jgi:prephenate dehydratase
MTKAALLGPGTFSEEAVRHVFGDRFEYVPCNHITDVLMSTVNGQTDISVVPVENTIEGSVNLHLDLLVHEVDLPIRAEWVYPIEMYLIGLRQTGGPGSADFSRITKVYTYPIAIAQCRQFLNKHLPNVEYGDAASTADGVRIIKELNDPHVAAIAPAAAARLYEADILASSIQDHQNNYTRFILVGKEPSNLPESDFHKTTVLVTLPEDYPGALHQVLSAFAWRRINLSKIESRPTKKKLGNYFFYIDIEASLNSVLLPAAIEEIRAIGCQVRIMGTYPSYTRNKENSEV